MEKKREIRRENLDKKRESTGINLKKRKQKKEEREKNTSKEP
jgi:hypothetical protein